MAYPFSMTEEIVHFPALTAKAGTGAAQPAKAVSMKLVHKLWACVGVNSLAGADACAIVPQTDTAVAFPSAAVFTTAVPIWVAAAEATSEELVRQADAVNHTLAAAAAESHVWFEIDPANMPTGDDCFRISLTAAATSFVSVDYFIAPRYAAGSGFRPNYETD